MRAELTFDTGAVLGGLLVLIRLSGLFVFVPMPGLKAAPVPIRAGCALLLTIALLPAYPVRFPGDPAAGALAMAMLGELGLGLMAGLIAGFLGDLFILTVQTFALQAGYSYASSIDPNSQADSNVLQSVAGLAAMLLFFHSGLVASLMRAAGRSLESWPPGTFWAGLEAGTAIVRFGGTVFELAVRLALPVAALLLLTDVTLALLGRINSQLQLLTLAFPVKMLGALAALAALTAALPGLYNRQALVAAQLLERWVR